MRLQLNWKQSLERDLELRLESPARPGETPGESTKIEPEALGELVRTVSEASAESNGN